MYQIIQTEPYLLLRNERFSIRLVPIGTETVRITMTGRDAFLPPHETENLTPVVLHNTPSAHFQITNDAQTVSLILPACTVTVNLNTGAFSYYDATGALLIREPQRGGKHLVETDVYRSVFSDTLQEQQTTDGVKAVADVLKTVKDRTAYHAKLEFEFGNEALYGFGSHEEGYGNLRGKSRQIYQQNMKACVPSFVSTKGYGFLFDCRSLMTFEDNGYGSYVWMDTVDELDYYFFAGTDFHALLKAYRSLTGTVPMLPKWAFGYGQSKERYETAQELIDIVSEYRREEIPLSFIIQDWMTWEPGKWGQKSFDATRYPDPKGLTDQLHALGAAMMISVWPNMNGMGENQKEFLAHNYMLGNRSTYNAFLKAARDMYWKQANEGIFQYGVDAWWCDCSEPFEADWHGELRPEPHERLRINVDEAKKYLDDAQISAYSLCHSRGIYEGQRNVTEEKRVVNLTRSSFAGQGRYGAITWSGDTFASYQTLAKQIPEGLNFCAAGEPYWSLDIGGFFTTTTDEWFVKGEYPDGVNDLGYRELYTRWLQLGTFLPMMRSHGTNTPREIWRFGEPGTPFYDAIAKFIKLRMELLPYLYSQAAAVSMNADTFITALGLAFPNDPNTFDITDQFMFGPSILVCPVTKPMYYESGSVPLSDVKKTRTVYLPAGCGWYDFFEGTYYQGGQTIEADAPIDKIPLFVKAGSIIPMGPALMYPAEDLHPSLTLRIYPGCDADFSLYDDEGDSYRYEQGAYTITPLNWDDHSKTLTIGKRQGSFAGMNETQQYHIQFLKRETTITTQNGEECVVSLS